MCSSDLAFNWPNDASFPQLWALDNIGQAVNGGLPGTSGADIRALSAWDVSVGSTAHVVAVIDTGVAPHKDLRGRIVFSSLPSVAFGLVTMALARFTKEHPGITARLIEDQDSNIVEKVLHREVDFGIGTLKTPHEELSFRELLPDELQAVFPLRHPLRLKRRLSWRDLASAPLVLLPKQSSVRALAEHGFAAAGIAREPDYEVANMVTALSMVRAGLGITIMPRMVLPELNMKGLAAARIHEPRPARTIGIVTRRDRPLSPAAAAYVELLFATTRTRAYNSR